MELKIEKIEITEIYTRLRITHEGKEHTFDISSNVTEADIPQMAEYYITEISRQ